MGLFRIQPVEQAPAGGIGVNGVVKWLVRSHCQPLVELLEAAIPPKASRKKKK
jgi:hypothetical protein